jgi:hypothetical protein
MNHMQLVVVAAAAAAAVAAAAGILVTVGSIVLGAWLDLRPGRRDHGSRQESRDAGGVRQAADRPEPGHRASVR